MIDINFLFLSIIFGIGIIVAFSDWFIETVKSIVLWHKRKIKVRKMVKDFFTKKLEYIEISKIIVKKSKVIIRLKKNNVTIYRCKINSLQYLLDVNFGIYKIDVIGCMFIEKERR